MVLKDRGRPMRVLMRQLNPFSYPGTTVCMSVDSKLLAVAEAVFVTGPRFDDDDDDDDKDEVWSDSESGG